MVTARKDERIPIAIVGMGCRFPGDATSPSKFWDLLRNGRDAYSPNTDRWNSDAFHHPNSKDRVNTLATKGGHFLKEDPYLWDASFFNITAAEAMALDPKQRIMMEVAYEALENAGMPLPRVAGSQTACYIGSSTSDYRDMVTRDFANWPKYYILGNCEEMVSNRISHFLDIHGPSATIQTACSSSLVATHLACQSLHSGESEMAIAGGVGLTLTPDGNIQLANLTFLNPEGHSRSFDADAGGYGRGEGAGALILKRLDKALADGDPIRAVIRATGANSDGWTQGVTLPSGEAQAALIKYVYESNGLDYPATQYVEAHGTGTKAGDPLEAGAISRTIGSGATKSRKLWMGSLKPNIGHLEAAAGVAGIIKGVLAMENGMIPPNIYFNKPNPAIPFDEWNMAVPTKLTPWPVCKTKRMSVSGFGMGGTNGHVVLESFNSDQWKSLLPANGVAHETANNKKRLFVFSSHDQAGFKRIGDKLVEHMDTLGPAASSPEYLAKLAHTLSVARSGLTWRWSCSAENAAELHHKLSTTAGDKTTRTPDSKPRIGFVFTGQGAQWAGMGVEMLKSHPVFKDSVTRSAALLKSMGCDWDPVEELTRSKQESRLKAPMISQPICTVLQIALVDELRSWGVTPKKVAGHSSGEIAAAYCAGALTHRDAIAIAYFRGKASSGLVGLKGGMMAVGCSYDQARSLLAQHGEHLGGVATVACVNSPNSVTISGDLAALERLRAILEKESMFARMLQVDVAYHSSHMQGAAADYAASIADIEPHSSEEDETKRVTMVSSVTGSEAAPELLGGYYWVRNLVSPVLFEQAIKEMVSPAAEADGKTLDLLIELGPHSALGGPIEQILSHHGISDVSYKSVLTRLQSAVDTSLQLASELFAEGVSLELQKVNGDSHCQLLTNLPPYPWNHSKVFRCDSRIAKELLAQKFPTRSLLGAPVPMMDETQRVWRSFLRLEDEPWLRGHMVGSTVLLPGAGMTSIILEASQQLVAPGKTARAFRLRDVSLFAAMALPEGVATEVIVHMRPYLQSTLGSTPAAWWEFTMSSCVGGDQLRDNCRGLMTIDYHEDTTPQMAEEDAIIAASRVADYHRVHKESNLEYAKENFYNHMNSASWKYGEAFQGIEGCHVGDGQSTFNIRVTDIGETYSKGQIERPFLIHAGTLDAVFQSWLSSTWIGDKDGGFDFTRPFVPVHFTELEISADIPGDVGYVMPGLCLSERYGFTDLSADMFMFDKDVSKPYLVVKDFRVAELNMDDGGGREDNEVDPTDITSEVRWNYALDVMEPQEISRVVSAIKPKDRMAEIIRMALHLNPAATLLQLVPDHDAARNSVIASLPGDIVRPSQVRYAVINAAKNPSTDKTAFVGEAFELGAVDSPLPENIPKADLLIISSDVEKVDKRDQFLERVLNLTKPEATVLIAAKQQPTPGGLEARGYDFVFGVEGDERLALYWGARNADAKPATNGTPARQAVIMEPTTMSKESRQFSKALQESLITQNYTVSTRTLTDEPKSDVAESEVLISLLELEKPLLDDLSEKEYENVKALSLAYQRLLWITCGDNPSFGVIDGLSRCVESEIAGTRFQVLHLSQETGLQHGPALASRILSSETTKDDEFHERDGVLQVTRIYRSLTENDSIKHHLHDSTRVTSVRADEDLRLSIERPGLLDTLQFIEDNRLNAPLADHEVEIKVKATGINFRDIMATMGLIPMSVLGQEGSGVVVKTGSEASRFKPGDRVSFLGVGTHATKIRVDHRIVAHIPDTMSFEEAAALPVVHTTAYHALVNLAKLTKGKSVLIHAAAGGVGQAAVQIALHLGLVVYVTVGSEDKRKLLVNTYGIPEKHIFNSRDASFAKSVMRITSGRGVDCVLNSLSGELLRTSWECLATFGTFVEIGLRDILDNTRLDMRPFGKSTTFTFFNQFTLYEEDPAALGQILDEAFKLVHKGTLRAPSPLTVHSMGQVGDAFRTIQQGKHRGKMVMSFTDNAEAPILRKAKNSLKLNADVTYLLVGGLGGLGRSLARQFIACGARNLAFLSRSGDGSPDAKALIKELSDMGANVKAYRGDVSDPVSFRAALSQCERELPPVRGVVQMAMALRDIVFEKMSYDWWKTGLRPKVQGTWNLHEYFNHERPLEFFIICSSISGMYGYPSQAQYSAGNTYQDPLAHYRRSQGLKAVSVNLGIMRDVGVLAEQGATGKFLLWEETLGIREPAFHAIFKGLINRQKSENPASWPPAQVTTGLGTADIMAAHGLDQPGYFSIPRFGPLAVTSSATSASGAGKLDTVSLSSRLSEASSKQQALNIITEALVKKVADILQMPVSEVDPGRPMYRYGVDSLVALEVRNWITKEMKATVALLEVLAAVPMEVFAARIADKSKLVAFE
ncbi:reducing polyketide synthase [Colletotrichum scovillei]|uniref:Reducing polyketide synthase n=2 Tax=Colletotrichum scovillei TaxID=1209932 RepID=A0A9P7QQH2_9PEZI|nr:reducing polyketide synthase [Colletotrichum scovillei]KAG7040379.1 reducing polyketide synthase [Colletotrichum scovillei]KAG7060428.1 reducing polyketide synthase [Colletotrichum scovillei]